MPVERGRAMGCSLAPSNQDAALEFEVTAPATDTVLARIIHTVEAAGFHYHPALRRPVCRDLHPCGLRAGAGPRVGGAAAVRLGVAEQRLQVALVIWS